MEREGSAGYRRKYTVQNSVRGKRIRNTRNRNSGGIRGGTAVRKRQPRRATRSKNSPDRRIRPIKVRIPTSLFPSLSLLRAFDHFVYNFGNRSTVSCSLYVYIYIRRRRNGGIMARISRHGCSPYSRYSRFFLITKLPRRCSRVTSLIAPRSPAPHSY